MLPALLARLPALGEPFSRLTVFFTRPLISNYNSFPTSVRVPLLFLIVSTFGFIYSTLIYANASGKLTNGNLKYCNKGLNTVDVLSEFIYILYGFKTMIFYFSFFCPTRRFFVKQFLQKLFPFELQNYMPP